MDIEHLNKFQLVLLALLVSFVTSIATGIVTVTLLAQAPPGVTETINHVVERTIETVVPKDLGSTKTTTTQTIVVNEEDLVTASIAHALQKTAKIFRDTASTSPVIGLAAEIAPGVLITDSNVVSKEHLVSIGNTDALFLVFETFPDIGIAVLTAEATSTPLGAPFKVGDTDAAKLGSTVTAILSVTNQRVAIGAVSAVFPLADVSRKGESTVSVRGIDTNLDASSITGAPLINVNGDLVGIATQASQNVSGKGAFVSVSDVLALLNAPATTTLPR